MNFDIENVQNTEISLMKQHNKKPSSISQQQRRQNMRQFQKSLIQRSIQKGFQSKFAFQKCLNIDYCLLIFCFTNVALSVLYYDADYVGKNSIAKWCLTLTDAISILQLIVTIIRYQSLVDLQKSQKILQEQQTINTSGKTYQIMVQILILFIQPYSFLNDIKIITSNVYDQFQFDFKINYILVVLGFSKMFVAIRVLLLRQIYMNPRSSRLCRMYGCQSNYLYAVKCLFKDSPLSLIGIVFVSSIVFFAVSLRIAERNLVIQYPKYFNGDAYPGDIQKFQNALWLTIITMTTVGYGDYFPRTIFGRAIDVVLVVWGTFIVSLMVVVLTNTLNMDQSQKRALIVLNRLQAKKSLKEAAAFVITHSCRKYLINKKISKKLRPPLTQQQRTKMQSSFYKYLSNFQSVHRVIRSMYEIDDIYQQMTRQFQFINDQVSFLLGNQQQTIGIIYNYINQEKSKKILVQAGQNKSSSLKQIWASKNKRDSEQQ